MAINPALLKAGQIALTNIFNMAAPAALKAAADVVSHALDRAGRSLSKAVDRVFDKIDDFLETPPGLAPVPVPVRTHAP